MRKEWIDIRDKVGAIHPIMIKKLNLLEENIVKAYNAAKQCDPDGISFAVDASKMVTKLCTDVNHLHAIGIIGDETLSEFRAELRTYSAAEFEKIFLEFASCVGKETEQEILGRLVERASEMAPEFQSMLVKFAQELREIERKHS